MHRWHDVSFAQTHKIIDFHIKIIFDSILHYRHKHDKYKYNVTESISINGFVQDYSKSIANTLQLCVKPSKWPMS